MPDMCAQDLHGNAVDNPKLALIESVCISWFTLEYLLRYTLYSTLILAQVHALVILQSLLRYIHSSILQSLFRYTPSPFFSPF